MKEYVRQVKDYYDENALTEWERLAQEPFEFAFTTYMMDRYIKPGDSILDIGGGPGRYAIHHAGRGCDVTLVDLSDGNVALARAKAAETGVEIRAIAADCLALDALDLDAYDHVFLMGPLYHLLGEADRARAVALALQRLKPGGLFYASFILDFAGLLYDLQYGPGLLPQALADTAMATIIDSITGGTCYEGPAFTNVCFMNQRAIVPFMDKFGLEKVSLFGQEGILAPNKRQILAFPPEERALWIETAKRFLELPELLSYSEHAMYIGRKA